MDRTKGRLGGHSGRKPQVLRVRHDWSRRARRLSSGMTSGFQMSYGTKVTGEPTDLPVQNILPGACCKSCGAAFQTCPIADSKSAARHVSRNFEGWETCDTADSEFCATFAGGST